MIEAVLQDAVIDLARTLRWRVAHFRPAKTESGWRTAVQGDGKGWPDLVMLRGGRGIAAELKDAKRPVEPEQYVWLDSFGLAGFDTFVWRPAQWLDGSIEWELKQTLSVLERMGPTADVDRAARLPCR